MCPVVSVLCVAPYAALLSLVVCSLCRSLSCSSFSCFGTFPYLRCLPIIVLSLACSPFFRVVVLRRCSARSCAMFSSVLLLTPLSAAVPVSPALVSLSSFALRLCLFSCVRLLLLCSSRPLSGSLRSVEKRKERGEEKRERKRNRPLSRFESPFCRLLICLLSRSLTLFCCRPQWLRLLSLAGPFPLTCPAVSVALITSPQFSFLPCSLVIRVIVWTSCVERDKRREERPIGPCVNALPIYRGLNPKSHIGPNTPPSVLTQAQSSVRQKLLGHPSSVPHLISGDQTLEFTPNLLLKDCPYSNREQVPGTEIGPL